MLVVCQPVGAAPETPAVPVWKRVRCHLGTALSPCATKGEDVCALTLASQSWPLVAPPYTAPDIICRSQASKAPSLPCPTVASSPFLPTNIPQHVSLSPTESQACGGCKYDCSHADPRPHHPWDVMKDQWPQQRHNFCSASPRSKSLIILRGLAPALPHQALCPSHKSAPTYTAHPLRTSCICQSSLDFLGCLCSVNLC